MKAFADFLQTSSALAWAHHGEGFDPPAASQGSRGV